MHTLLTTAEASRLAGVGPTAIKRWADEGRLHCVKTAGGHRRFRRAELEALLRQAAAVAASQWDDWFDALLDQEGPFRVEAHLLTTRARLGSWAHVADELGLLLQEMGERWRRGSITISEEHIVSERLRRAVARIAEALPVPPDAPACLLATADGDPHTGGLWLAELTLREAGFRTLWAGSPLPTKELVAAVRRWQPRLTAVSASSISTASALAKVYAAVSAACRQAGSTLVLGGAGAWPEPTDKTAEKHPTARFAHFAEFAEFARPLASR